MSEERVPASQNRDVRQTIVHLLSNMSDGREIRSYLQRFSEVDRSRFAVIKIGGAILAEHLEETAAALAFLHTVGLTPIVIHGGGTQLDRALDQRGIESRRIDGLRVTEPDVLDAARDTFIEQNILLVEAIREQGVAAHGLTAGAFEADYVDRDKYGLVGEPTEVHIALIRSIVDSGAIPILTCLGVAPGGQIVNMNADAATRALVHAVQPLKIIFLVDVGGLLDDDGRPIESINLASDYDHLMAQDWVHSGMRLKLVEIKRLLDDTPLSTSVSITTPSGLVKELFTHGGSGTLVRKGELIERVTDPGSIDGSQVVKLVEEAFGRPLKEGWWHGLDLASAYLSESLRAGAIVSRVGDISYLDKFAILEDARGEGLARTVWAQLIADHPVLYWRSRTENRFNSFYADEADGSVKRGSLDRVLEGRDRLRSHRRSGSNRSRHSPHRSWATTMSERHTVGVVGARGHTGAELVRLIRDHPSLELLFAGSRELAGEPVPGLTDILYESIGPEDLAGRDLDVVILALPDGAGDPYFDVIDDESVIVDISADHRFDDNWAYGLPELYREKLKGATAHRQPRVLRHCHPDRSRSRARGHLRGAGRLRGLRVLGSGDDPRPA